MDDIKLFAKNEKEQETLIQTISIVIYKALCFDVAQGRMNGAPNETQTHSCRFAQTISIYSQDIGMGFGIEKCAKKMCLL